VVSTNIVMGLIWGFVSVIVRVCSFEETCTVC